MSQALSRLDDLLRGRSTTPLQLAENAQGLPLGLFLRLAVALGAVYGVSMGLYAATGHQPAEYRHLLSSAIKIPALFLLTLAVTFPSLYVFSVLGGCTMKFLAVLRLLVATVVVNLALGASLAPILAFFTFSTTSYAFMIVLNVLLLAVSGAVALGFLVKVLRRLAAESSPEDGTGVNPSAGTAFFNIWVLLYALVGAQMGWLLRPFIGNPSLPFAWFRPRSGNFFQAVFDHIRHLFAITG
jgi:hypothetical protein